jgi:hypothetical protein
MKKPSSDNLLSLSNLAGKSSQGTDNIVALLGFTREGGFSLLSYCRYRLWHQTIRANRQYCCSARLYSGRGIVTEYVKFQTKKGLINTGMYYHIYFFLKTSHSFSRLPYFPYRIELEWENKEFDSLARASLATLSQRKRIIPRLN